MEHCHLRQMQRIAGAAAQPKLRLLGFWAGGGEIADPWYTGDFVCAADEIEAGCRGLLNELQRELR